MQIRSEEQEDEDKQKIALMGQKDNTAPKTTKDSENEKSI
jgi:hypothetical protein